MDFQTMIGNAIHLPDFIEPLLGEIPRSTVALSGGTVSAVYRVELADGTLQVLKFSDDFEWLRRERIFLDAWSGVGLCTPNIYEHGPLPDGRQGAFLRMEYLRGQNLFELMERDAVPSDKILRDLGMILARMHQVTASGYGEITIDSNGQIVGEAETFQQSISSSLAWNEAIDANLRNGDLLESEVALIDCAAARLDRQRAGVGGCLVHNDFRAGNILYDDSSAQPYTVIDPNPALTHPYLCLAYSLILEEIHGRNDPQCFEQGYADLLPIDNDALHAARFLRALELLPRWGQPGNQYADPLRRLFEREKRGLARNV